MTSIRSDSPARTNINTALQSDRAVDESDGAVDDLCINTIRFLNEAASPLSDL
ncbi:MAG TPA: hypothetical protein VE569_11375 [Acidimicrobiia bacterium]|jgi:hypothetical protein|nr:hypothetical protein [Acidimicrobiia bacterium]